MYCSTCGAKLSDGQAMCGSCGAPTYQGYTPPDGNPYSDKSSQGLITAALVFMGVTIACLSIAALLCLFGFGIAALTPGVSGYNGSAGPPPIMAGVLGVGYLLPLAWVIPMTVKMAKIRKGTSMNTVAYGVCVLLFCNMISGILLLVAPKEG